jgi:hypothetical protein
VTTRIRQGLQRHVRSFVAGHRVEPADHDLGDGDVGITPTDPHRAAVA